MSGSTKDFILYPLCSQLIAIRLVFNDHIVLPFILLPQAIPSILKIFLSLAWSVFLCPGKWSQASTPGRFTPLIGKCFLPIS